MPDVPRHAQHAVTARAELPPVSSFRQLDTDRFIPYKYSEGGDSVLARIADYDAHLQAILDLAHATNERLLAENNFLAGIGVDELVFAVPHYRIVNAAVMDSRCARGSFSQSGALGFGASGHRGAHLGA